MFLFLTLPVFGQRCIYASIRVLYLVETGDFCNFCYLLKVTLLDYCAGPVRLFILALISCIL
uniref:Uncharacterized protein n=1 Tax=Oryza brachyantha TaxID=4533 RepID=J3N289_ORYBR